MAGPSAWAQTWGGGASGQWTTATNWSADTLPTASSDVVFDTANAAITLSTVETVNKLTIKVNTTFTDSTLSLSSTVSPGLVLANGVIAIFNNALSTSGNSAVGVTRKNKAAEAAGPVRRQEQAQAGRWEGDASWAKCSMVQNRW